MTAQTHHKNRRHTILVYHVSLYILKLVRALFTYMGEFSVGVFVQPFTKDSIYFYLYYIAIDQTYISAQLCFIERLPQCNN